MDITSSPPTTTPTTPTTTTTNTTSIKSLDQDSRIQPNHTLPKHLPPPFTNGVLKRHKPRHHSHHNPHPVVVTYKECLKNHAASMGGHAVDGCGEFMPSASSTPTDPTSLKCAACGCHRNFHRRAGDLSTDESFLIEYQPHHRHHPPPPPPPPQLISVAGVTPNSSSPADSPSPPPISSSYYPSAPHMLLALSSGISVQQHPETHYLSGSNPNTNGKKRFRTKFSQDQKEKMHELAERVGWKMQKRDEELIKGFCNEIGVDKGVFKVWMHNNKMTFGVKNNSINNKDSGGGIDFLTDRNNHHELQHHHQQQEQEQEQQGHNDSVSSGGGNVIGTNGSSSSS